MMRMLLATALTLTLAATCAHAQEETPKAKKWEIKAALWHLKLVREEGDVVKGDFIYAPAGSGSSLHSYEGTCKGKVEEDAEGKEKLRLVTFHPIKPTSILTVDGLNLTYKEGWTYDSLDDAFEDNFGEKKGYYRSAEPHLYLVRIDGEKSIPVGQERNVVCKVGDKTLVAELKGRFYVRGERLFWLCDVGSVHQFSIHNPVDGKLEKSKLWFMGKDLLGKKAPAQVHHAYIINGEGWVLEGFATKEAVKTSKATAEDIAAYKALRRELGLRENFTPDGTPADGNVTVEPNVN